MSRYWTHKRLLGVSKGKKPKRRKEEILANPKQSGGSGKPKHEHNVVVSGAIAAHTPVKEQKQHRAEREEDATTHTTERRTDRRWERGKMCLEGIGLLAGLFYSGGTTWQGYMLA